MSNTKVLNFSSSSATVTATMSSKTSAFKSTTSSFDAGKLTKVPPHSTNNLKISSMSRRKPCENSNKSIISTTNNFSPLRSPQLIRTKNWINSTNNNINNNNNNKVSSGGSSTCSDESIIPKYESNNNTASTSQKRAYNFNRVSATTTKKLLNGVTRNTAITAFEQHNARVTTVTAPSVTSNLSRNSDMNKSFKGITRVPNKIFKPTIINSSGCSTSSSSSLASMTNKSSYSSKYPNGLPFEDEFYHYRNVKTNLNLLRNNMRIASSVASDKSSSSLSNNSQNNDGIESHHDLMRSSPYFPQRRPSSPYDSDVMYVDFTLKSTVDKLKQTTAKAAATVAHSNNNKKTTTMTSCSSLQPKLSAVKMTYYINDKNDNCFCEFESIKSTNNGAFNKLIDSTGMIKHEQQQHVTAIDKRYNKNDSVIYTALAW